MIAQMPEVNPVLTPAQIRTILFTIANTGCLLPGKQQQFVIKYPEKQF